MRDAVDRVDRERAERIQEWQRLYGEYLDREKDHKDRERGRGEVPVTPFLLLRYAKTDMGVRPITAASRFWETPYIWVESSDPYGNPVAGESNYLHALVFNGGAFQAAPVKVDFYWADPSLGLGPASMNYIGTEWVMIDSLGSFDVRCSAAWIPTVVNDGHECVMVNTSCALADPILQPFQPLLDRHVGQKNLHVVPGHAGQTLMYTLQVNNIFPIPMQTTIAVRFDQMAVIRGAGDFPLHQLGGLAATDDLRTAHPGLDLTDIYVRHSDAHRIAQRSAVLERHSRTSAPRFFTPLEGMGMAISVESRGPRGMMQSTGMGRFAGDLLTSLDTFREMPGTGYEGRAIQDFMLEPFALQSVDVQLQVPTNAEPGQIFIARLSQHAGPLTVGGYSIVVVIE